MADLVFTTKSRKNSAIDSYQWRAADGEQLPLVRFFADGGYFYFDNQQPPPGNTFPIHDGYWVIRDGAGPSERFYVLSDNDYRLQFNA